MRRFLLRAMLAIAILVGFLELGVRLAGVVSFPLYHADARIGYIPKPSQEGGFLRTNTWAFNELSMGVARRFDPSAAARDLLLVGDSIVLGGNTLPQESKLAARLESSQGRRVWPIAAGSWALLNELQYLKDHPDVPRSVGHIVFVLNSGDFDQASSWACDLTHPRDPPPVALLYAARKYVHNWAPCGLPPAGLLVPPGDWRQELKQLIEAGLVNPGRVTVVLYPNRKEALDPKLMRQRLETHVPELKAILGERLRLINVAHDPRWDAGLYRDDIHPTQEGYQIFASLLRAYLDVSE